MVLMLPRLCCTDWSAHSSQTVVTRAGGIIQGALSWRFVYKCKHEMRRNYRFFYASA
jgi:hypothetical protein